MRIRTKAPAPGKKQLKGISTGEDVEVTLDTEWLSEHAAQVAKLLPGGEFFFYPHQDLRSSNTCDTLTVLF